LATAALDLTKADLSDITIGLFRRSESQPKGRAKLAKPLDRDASLYPGLMRKVLPTGSATICDQTWFGSIDVRS